MLTKLPAWYQTYTTVITWLWVIVTARATYVSARSIGRAREDLADAQGTNGLRARLGRAHLRRESMRLVAFIPAFLLGVAAWTPLSKKWPLEYGAVTVTILVYIIAMLYINSELDWKLRNEMRREVD